LIIVKHVGEGEPASLSLLPRPSIATDINANTRLDFSGDFTIGLQ
jgi:hypothetical protein